MRLCVIGAGNGNIFIEAITERGVAVLEKSGLKSNETPAGRDEAVKKLIAARTEARDKKFAEFRAETNSFEALEDKLAACVNCYNCRIACPAAIARNVYLSRIPSGTLASSS